MATRRSTINALCWCAALALFVGSCAGPEATIAPTTAPVAQATEAPAEMPTSPPPEGTPSGFEELGPITLELWDNETLSGPSNSVDEIVLAFESKYPNVTINRTKRAFDDHVKVVKLALSGEEAPCIAEGNQGYYVDGALVEAGLIIPLDKYAEAYGWLDRYSPAAIAPNMWSPDGKSWGEGSLFGVSVEMQQSGIYFNKAKLADLGVSWPPHSIEEFEAALEKAKQAGELPIMLGDIEKWPGGIVMDQFIAAYAPSQTINDWIFGRSGSNINTPEVLAGIQKFAEFGAKGYFGTDYLGIGYDDSLKSFAAGQGVFYISGTWSNNDFYTLMGDNVGFECFPGPGGTCASVVGIGQPFEISSKCEYPDVAAAFLDMMIDANGSAVAVKYNRTPAYSPPGLLDLPMTDLMRTSISNLVRVLDDKGNVFFLDWASPTMYDLLAGGHQEVLAGVTLPEDLLPKVQADRDAFLASR